MKVEFIKTTYNTKTGKVYKAGKVEDIEEDFYNDCLKLNSIVKVTSINDIVLETKKEVEPVSEVVEEKEFNLKETISKMTVEQLKNFCKQNDVSLKGITKKADIINAILEEDKNRN